MSFILWHAIVMLTSLALAFTMGYYTAKKRAETSKRKKING